MKTTLTILFLLFTLSLSGQQDTTSQPGKSPYRNALAVSLQMDSWSWGARYERRGYWIGGYAYAVKGDFPDNPSGIDKETVIGAGLVFPWPNLFLDYFPAITIGMNRAWYTYYSEGDPFADTGADNPISIDVGISAQHGRVNWGFQVDVYKWLPKVYLGINF